MPANRYTEYERLKLNATAAYMGHITDLKGQHDIIEEKIELIRSKAMPGGIRYDKPMVSTSPSPDAIPDAVITAMEQMADLETALSDLEEEFDRFCGDVIRLDSVGGTYYYLHYAIGMPWNAIAETAGVDVSTITQRRREAMLELYDKGLVPLEYRIPAHRAI